MFPVDSRRDDPTRDLSKNILDGENFYAPNHADIREFIHDTIEVYPEEAGRFDYDEQARKFLLDLIYEYANVDPSRQGDEYDRFMDVVEFSFANQYNLYQLRQKKE